MTQLLGKNFFDKFWKIFFAENARSRKIALKNFIWLTDAKYKFLLRYFLYCKKSRKKLSVLQKLFLRKKNPPTFADVFLFQQISFKIPTCFRKIIVLSFQCTNKKHNATKIPNNQRGEPKPFSMLNSIDFIVFCQLKFFQKFFAQHILEIFGEKFEFHNEFLFKALSKLNSIRFRIVILYYCLEKTDGEICSLLHLSSRQSVQYQRQQAIIQLRQWIQEMEDDYAFT